MNSEVPSHWGCASRQLAIISKRASSGDYSAVDERLGDGALIGDKSVSWYLGPQKAELSRCRRIE